MCSTNSDWRWHRSFFKCGHCRSTYFIASVKDDMFELVGGGGGGIDSWNWVRTKYGIESAMSCKMFIFKAGIIPCRQLPYCLRVLANRGVLPPHTTFVDENSEIFNSFTWNHRCLQESIPQRHRFLTRDRFRKTEDPGLKTKNLKIRALVHW
jgi:hypothetical protein